MGKSPHRAQEEVQLRVRVGVDGDLEERLENVLQQLLKVFNDALRPVDVVQPRDLQPTTKV